MYAHTYVQQKTPSIKPFLTNNNFYLFYSVYYNFIFNPILMDHKYVLRDFVKEKAFLLHM
jgi:hypothetical protein